MLETVIVQSAAPLTFNITDVDPNEILVVKSISGLTSAKVGLFTGDFAGEGGYYQGRRAEKLTPVITLKMNPDYKNDVEVSDIREMLYRTFYQPQPGSDGVKVLLKDDRKPDRYFVGYTEDINTDQFSKDTSVQISMMCMEGFLYSDAYTAGSDPAGWLTLPIAYPGTANAGIAMQVKINTATPRVTIDLNGNKMVLDRAFTVGQVIYINTRQGEREIRFTTGGDIMAALSPASPWVQLDRPNNTIKVYGSVEGDGKAVLTAYDFRARWWGI